MKTEIRLLWAGMLLALAYAGVVNAQVVGSSGLPGTEPVTDCHAVQDEDVVGVDAVVEIEQDETQAVLDDLNAEAAVMTDPQAFDAVQREIEEVKIQAEIQHLNTHHAVATQQGDYALADELLWQVEYYYREPVKKQSKPQKPVLQASPADGPRPKQPDDQ